MNTEETEMLFGYKCRWQETEARDEKRNDSHMIYKLSAPSNCPIRHEVYKNLQKPMTLF